ncbi:nuclear transport factor 2 family protein [Amycolatopsis thermalba]|uniref:Nuclear transport factor 2 family protein n=1 Tax=Amycolatopsis thermalba TaxID=944492 RepID=A0ABY4P119_9PSEU|nr:MULTISPECIES: nuclear transport factor 2 family protein [Amycolatopsis]UQS25971.1 nuclear transport factor 2 family protein [Amycolatopsis thermalba]
MSSDREQILDAHKGWYETNVGLAADRMLDYFPSGDKYHQFNLNGHTYHGARDKHRLWVNAAKIGLDITAIKDTVGPDVQVFGDVALLTAEGVADLLLPGQSDSVPTPFRTTEFYRRDDGDGQPVWKIWHMHCSVMDQQMPKYGTE